MTAVPDRHPNVTVSIVSHNQQALLLPLIEQLNTLCGKAVAKIVLTVNVPESELVTHKEWCIPLEVIHNPTPKGFGANHNTAFNRCHTNWFLVLNPDIRMTHDVVSALLAQAKPDTGLLLPRIREPGKAQPESYRRLLTPYELWERRRAGHRPPDSPQWVAGMFMLLQSTAFRRVCGFDERFFMYCEDFDLCARLRLDGWSLHSEPSLEVLHVAQRSSHRAIQPLLWHLASFARTWTSAAFWRYRALLRRQARRPDATPD